MEIFPQYMTLVRYRNELPLSFPSCGFTAPVGSPAMCSSVPSHAHVCAQHPGGSGCPFPGETLLQEFPGEQHGRHSCAPRHLHLLGLQPWGVPAVPVGVFRGKICSDAIYLKLSELLTHTRLHQLLCSPVDSTCPEGTDMVDFPSPDVSSRQRLEVLLRGML